MKCQAQGFMKLQTGFLDFIVYVYFAGSSGKCIYFSPFYSYFCIFPEMTISYSDTFIKLLLRWKGSLWKAIWKHLLIFLVFYYCINIVYRFIMDDRQVSDLFIIQHHCQIYPRLNFMKTLLESSQFLSALFAIKVGEHYMKCQKFFFLIQIHDKKFTLFCFRNYLTFQKATFLKFIILFDYWTKEIPLTFLLGKVPNLYYLIKVKAVIHFQNVSHFEG